MSHSHSIDRRTALGHMGTALAAGAVWSGAGGNAAPGEPPRVLPAGKLPEDGRLKPLKDYNGYFPFTPGKTPEEWEKRREYVQRQMLVACGLWPLPKLGAVKATVHGKVDREDYTVERVFFESAPGLYVTGSLYRPKGVTGKLPAVLCPHGHWSNGRFHTHGARVKNEIASGAERFEAGGRHPLQARCVQLARMGCLVFHYDMLGYADSAPVGYQLAHRFSKQRGVDHRGLFSPQAEMRLINVLGMQTLNSIRSLDWIAGLPEVDAKRIGVTGASGGGTQTFMLAALDERIAAAFPAVMVSTAMQGGCTCENACYLRVNTGNIEFAAMVAPRPIAMSAANDWTKELETKGLPELRKHFEMLGVPDHVDGKHFEFGHNYNAVSRAMMYEFFNKHLKLGRKSPIVERDYKPLSIEEMTVWNGRHPKPKADDAAEMRVVDDWAVRDNRLIDALEPKDAKSLKRYREVVGGGWDVMVGRKLPDPGGIDYIKVGESKQDGYAEYRSLLRLGPHNEELPVIFLLPGDWNKQVVLWLHPDGKAGLYKKDGKLRPEIARLVEDGASVAGVDLLYQGDFLKPGEKLTQAPKVKNPRQFAGYTLGYNHPLCAQRTHDVLTALSYIADHRLKPEKIDVVGIGRAAVWAAAAVAQAPGVASRLAVDTQGFRFAKVRGHRDPMMWPGALKYGDIPGLLSLCSPTPLAIAGEESIATIVNASYKSAGKPKAVTLVKGKPAEGKLVDWLTG